MYGECTYEGENTVLLVKRQSNSLHNNLYYNIQAIKDNGYW